MNIFIRNIIFGTIIFYLQLLFMPKLSLFGIIPDIYIPFVIILGQKNRLIESVPIVLFFGIAGDLFYPELLGLHTFGLLIITILVNKFHHSINKGKLVSVLSSISIIIIFMMMITFISFFWSFNDTYFLCIRYFLYNLVFATFSVYFYAVISRVRLFIDV